MQAAPCSLPFARRAQTDYGCSQRDVRDSELFTLPRNSGIDQAPSGFFFWTRSFPSVPSFLL